MDGVVQNNRWNGSGAYLLHIHCMFSTYTGVPAPATLVSSQTANVSSVPPCMCQYDIMEKKTQNRKRFCPVISKFMDGFPGLRLLKNVSTDGFSGFHKSPRTNNPRLPGVLQWCWHANCMFIAGATVDVSDGPLFHP